MRVTDEQRLQLIAAALSGLCANPEMKYDEKYNHETGEYDRGYVACGIADLAVIHADEVVKILEKEGGESIASTEETQSSAA